MSNNNIFQSSAKEAPTFSDALGLLGGQAHERLSLEGDAAALVVVQPFPVVLAPFAVLLIAGVLSLGILFAFLGKIFFSVSVESLPVLNNDPFLILGVPLLVVCLALLGVRSLVSTLFRIHFAVVFLASFLRTIRNYVFVFRVPFPSNLSIVFRVLCVAFTTFGISFVSLFSKPRFVL
jgi:hypothetical protein